MKIKALVEKGSDGLFAVTSEECVYDCFFGGYGNSVSEAKADFLQSIEDSFEAQREMGNDIPQVNIEVEYVYDVPSLFNVLNWVNVTAFAKRANINASKLRAYKSGLAKASEPTVDRIRSAVREMASEMAESVF